MANFTNFHRTATAAVGALLISTAFVAAAVGPAATAANGPSAPYAAAHIPASVQADA